jgi:hypothetical protein
MKTRPGTEYVPWMLGGVVVLSLLLLVVWHFRDEADPAQQLALKATRADLVGRMQLALAAGSEAEKSAVLAITDADSETFAGQARAADVEVEQEYQDLEKLLATGGTPRERELLTQFVTAFGNLQRVDDQVLSLAVKNTNVKAYGLLFGPLADRSAQINRALAAVIAKRAESPDAKQVMVLADGARIGVLSIQVQLAPHIAEESDAKMDLMEASMTKEESQVRKALDALSAMPKLQGDADVATATSGFAGYGELKEQILRLSRENTNVRSLALSLNQKRKALVLCLDALNSLQQAILEEPIRGVTYGRPPNPR